MQNYLAVLEPAVIATLLLILIFIGWAVFSSLVSHPPERDEGNTLHPSSARDRSRGGMGGGV